MRLTIVNSFIHRFEPHGVSLVLVIAESHLAIHTWPELGYMNIDVLSCSKDTNLKDIKKIIKDVFSPTKIIAKEIEYS
jgi:S-adenosylmethionine decarboxylase